MPAPSGKKKKEGGYAEPRKGTGSFRLKEGKAFEGILGPAYCVRARKKRKGGPNPSRKKAGEPIARAYEEKNNNQDRAGPRDLERSGVEGGKKGRRLADPL